MGRKPVPDSTSHAVLGVVVRVRGGRLEALLAPRRAPPRRVARGGARARGRRRRARARRAARDARPPRRHARDGVPRARARRRPSSPATGAVGSDAGATMPSSSPPRRRGCARSSRTRTSASRSLRRRSRSRSCARCTSRRSATTCRRRISSACCCAAASLEPSEGRRAPGRTGGRPAALFRFASRSSR